MLLALQWLIVHNPLYSGFGIDDTILNSLPEDDIPLEPQASMRHDPEDIVLNRKHDGYVDPELNGGKCLIVVNYTTH